MNSNSLIQKLPQLTKLISLHILLGLLAMLQPLHSVTAQDYDTAVASVAEREIARRQALADNAYKAIDNGERAMVAMDYQEALKQFKSAYDWLPESLATDKIRAKALNDMSRAGVALGEQLIEEGRFEDARKVLELVIAEGYDEDNKSALRLLSRMEDPTYFNQTITPAFVAAVEEVKKLLNEAEGFYDTGRYDLAIKRTDQVLNIDPYNSAARRIQEKVNKEKYNYGEDAYLETRSRMLEEVQRAWESPIRQYGAGQEIIIQQEQQDQIGTASIQRKLQTIIIPSINFKDATVREAIDFLKLKSQELDTAATNPADRGVNIVLQLESGTDSGPTEGLEGATIVGGGSEEKRITMQLTNVPLGTALDYIARLADLKVKVEPFAVAVVPLSTPTEELITKTYRVPPDFIKREAAADDGGFGGGGLGGGLGGVGGDATGAGASLTKLPTAKDYLMSQGIEFPPGASANYLAASSQLVVRNTPSNLELVDTLVDIAITQIPKQVEISSKFVEISQTNTKEFGFDWLLGAANIPGNEGVFAAGGTGSASIGTGPPQGTNFPFVDPAGNIVGTNPITSGIRSGSFAIEGNTINSLIQSGITGAVSQAVAPGVLGIAGVFTDPQFQVVIRALNQKKGVDLLSSPKVTTKSGQRATIEIIREFIYPVEFDPPQVPQSLNGGGAVVTPTTPTAFETRNTGVTLEVEPIVGPDGYTIDLNLIPQVVEFEGFINYGSPINSVSTDFTDIFDPITGIFSTSSNTSSALLTENRIDQPIFATRKVTTSVTIWDGQTVGLGGLMREDVQSVEDKVPLLGDIPLIGRAFRSNVDQHVKRNLLIFVTANLIDPSGQAILQRGALEEDEVEPTILDGQFDMGLPELPVISK